MKTEPFWCPGCQRAFLSQVPDDYSPGMVIEKIGQPDPEDEGAGRYLCPAEGCDEAIVNCLHWSKLRENHPELPEVPQDGEIYPI